MGQIFQHMDHLGSRYVYIYILSLSLVARRHLDNQATLWNFGVGVGARGGFRYDGYGCPGVPEVNGSMVNGSMGYFT